MQCARAIPVTRLGSGSCHSGWILMNEWMNEWIHNIHTYTYGCSPVLAIVVYPSTTVKSKAIPGQALRVPGGSGSQISKLSAHEGGKVVSPRHWPPLPQENMPLLISVTSWVDPRAIVRQEGLCQWRIPMSPATFGLLAQCLNQTAPPRAPSRVSGFMRYSVKMWEAITVCSMADWCHHIAQESLVAKHNNMYNFFSSSLANATSLSSLSHASGTLHSQTTFSIFSFLSLFLFSPKVLTDSQRPYWSFLD